VEVERQQTFVSLPLFGDGAWTFPSLTAFLQNQPSLFLGALPGQTDAARNIGEWRVASYAQDEWRVSQRITVNLGLRYDPRAIASLDKGQTLVNGVQSTGFTPVTQAFQSNPTLQNWEPRVGIALDPWNDHRTAIRVGYGIFHSPITANRIGPAYGVNPPFALGAQVRLPIPFIPPPVFPTPNPSASQISLSQGLDYNVTDTPQLQQWNANVQREILTNTSVTLAYVGSHGHHLQQQRDINPVLPRTLADGTVIYGVRAGTQTMSNPRLNPTFNALTSGNTISESNYQSFQAALNRRFERGVQSQVSYTVSRCRDTSSGNSLFEGGQVATNPYDINYDYGPCLIDRTHNLRASVVYQLPFHGNRVADGWQVSAIVSAVSGAPFSPVIGFDQSGLQTAGQRPNLASGRSLDNVVSGGTLDATCGCIIGYFDPTAFVLPAAGTLGTSVGRDTLRGPALFTTDLGVSKNIAFGNRSTYVQLRLEVFNLFNRVNYGPPNPTIFIATADGGGAYNPTAGQITTALAPRQLQLAVKLVF
jgi:hypothetical protein